MHQNYVLPQSRADTRVPKCDTGVPNNVPAGKLIG